MPDPSHGPSFGLTQGKIAQQYYILHTKDFFHFISFYYGDAILVHSFIHPTNINHYLNLFIEVFML